MDRGPSHDDAWLDPPQQRSWRALIVGMTLLRQRLDSELRAGYGLSLSEYEVLVRLSESDDHRRRMSQLASSLCLSRSRLTHTVARMEKAGLVERETTADDGRGVIAHVTDSGMNLIESAAPMHVASVREHLVDLAASDDLLALGRVMSAVAEDLDPGHPDLDTFR